MFKSYLKIAFRNLRENKSYTFINILGLAIGLACCILITMYVVHELSYDQFHENSDRLYRITKTHLGDDQSSSFATTFSALAPTIKQEFSSVKHVSHIYPTSGLLAGPDNTRFQEENIIYADSAFFEMFSFPLKRGSSQTALDEPFSMVISERAAVKYFGSQNPVGNTLTFEDSRNSYDFKITGVVENPPENSHIQFDYVISYESLQSMRPWEYNTWYYPPMYTYVELSSKSAAADLEKAFPEMYVQYRGEEAKQYELDLQPVTDIHLYSDLQDELSATSDITYIYLFGAVAVFILLIACINFMNLATARSMERAREVGMRKTLGAGKTQLIGQYLSEAVMMTLISLILALLIVETGLPYFNSIAGQTLSMDLFSSWKIPLSLLGLVLIVGVIAGSYPAFYLSSFEPVQVLKGTLTKEGSSSARFRKGLVVFQFIISTGLIFGTVVITKQLDYIQNENLGFDKEQVLLIPIREASDQFNITSLKQEILRVPGVEHASAVSGVPGIREGIHSFNIIPEENKRDTLNISALTVDHDYVETLGLDVIKGRDFSKEYGTDESSAFVINRSAAEKMDWENPIGRKITLQFYVEDLVEKKGKIIGVVENFQYHSLHSSINPVLLHIYTETFYHNYLSVRFSTDKVQNVLGGIEQKWEGFNPSRPFENRFLDDTFDQMYRSEQQLSEVFNVFALIAVFVACLGLFGLASYSTEQRIKEIGIRKALGAGVSDILGLLSRDFLKLVVLGFLIALPISFYFVHRWLNNFAKQIDVGIGIFLFVGLVAVLVAIVAVGYQTLRAALVNPAESLRSE